jgi:Tol biopolymer transport system component
VTRQRGEAFVFIAVALSAALQSRAGEAPGGGLADLLPAYAVSKEAREAAETRLSSPTAGGDHDPAPSPDGAWVAFASTRDSAQPQLYRRDTTGGPVRRLTSGLGARVQPAVAPDGTQIACAGEVAGSWDILVLPAEGGREANLTATPDLDEIHPTWSPSGDALAFSCRDPADGVWWICAKRRGAARASRICEGLYPEWSPSGDRIVFQRARGRGRGEFALWVVEVAEAAGAAGGGFVARGGAIQIRSSTSAGAVGPVFGPRGEWIAFVSIPLPEKAFAAAPRGGDVMAVRTDGSGLRRVPTSRSVCRGPAWSGGRIVFSSDDDAGRASVWSVAAGTE